MSIENLIRGAFHVKFVTHRKKWLKKNVNDKRINLMRSNFRENFNHAYPDASESSLF